MSERQLYPFAWQQEQWQQLLDMHRQGRLPHALMLAGPQGVGKRHFAQAFARWVMCSAPVDDRPCGQCRSCQLHSSETHPDFMLIEPEEQGKAIKVDQVRDLTELLSKTAQQGGYKVAVVAPAEAMNLNSANAILKSLEEPAAQTLMILISHTPSAVLPTIRSRCQIRSFNIPPAAMVEAWLAPLLQGREVPLQVLMKEANGAPLAALDLLEKDALTLRQEYLAGFTRLSLHQASGVEVAAKWYGGDNPALMDWYLSQLHRLTRYLSLRDASELLGWPSELIARVEKVNPNILHRYLEKVLLTKRQLLSGANPNKQLLWEELLLDWLVVLRAK